jgi:disulfide bond formation protein DsbB
METLKDSTLRFLNALLLIVISSVLLGAYIYEFTYKQYPCPLCYLQRLAMILICFGPLLNLKFGFKSLNYSISLFAAVFGAAVSIRQIALRLFSKTPATDMPVWGHQLYVWALFVFASSILAVGLLLLLLRDERQKEAFRTNLFEKFSAGYIFLIVIANVVTSIFVCGMGFCSDT